MKKHLILLASIVFLGAGCVSSSPIPDSGTVGADTDSAVSADSGSGDIEQPVVTPSTLNTIVDLSNQGLTSLPKYILERTDIEELDISGNNMTGALPAEIRHLSRLRVLNASNNQFTGVPAEVGQLRNLQVLDYSNNQLTGLPYELGNLKSLKVLDLSGNDYSELDLGIIREGLPLDVDIRL
jgi:Leucine-rich repeat (LRR) protein